MNKEDESGSGPGKTVVITGCTKGLGFACAGAFLAECARLGIVSRSQHNLDSACGELPGAFGMTTDPRCWAWWRKWSWGLSASVSGSGWRPPRPKASTKAAP